MSILHTHDLHRDFDGWVLVSLHTLQMNHLLINLITCSVKGVWLAELLIEVSFLQPSVVIELFLGLLCQVYLHRAL